ncbi:hypothetical protein BGZ83_002755 [Gryganskiella cystojenkinii]|nr:hypothetical protein BGZ83_002755 [Gryganskiella cystojenkinii]
MGPKSKKKNNGAKPKTLASLKAQVASQSTSSSGSSSPQDKITPTTSVPPSPADAKLNDPNGQDSSASSPSIPSSTVNHIAVPVESNQPMQVQDSTSSAHAHSSHSRNPQRSPSLPSGATTVTSSDHDRDQNEDDQEQEQVNHSHNHNNDHSGKGHVHAPQSLVDSQSIIHTMPTSSTPLKASLGQSYGSSKGPVIVRMDSNQSHNHGGNDHAEFHHGPHDVNSPPLRPSTPPPIVCKGVLITNESTKNKRKLIFVTILCLCFFTLEMVGAYFSRSLALMSDAFHLLSDVVSFMVSLIAIWLSEQPATKRHSFGYHRAEVLAALMSVFIIWIMTAFLLMEAVERIQNPKAIDGKAMCIVATIGVFINIILAFALGHDHSHGGHGHDHDHDHNDSHSHSHEHGNGSSHSHNESHTHDHGTVAHKKEANINVKAATLHVIGDLISSVGVLIASIIIWVKPSWTIVDPICTVLFSILVMFTTYRLVLDSLGILMEGTPTHIDPEEVEAALKQIHGVTVVHDLHVWNLTAGKPSLAVHLGLSPASSLTTEPLTMADYDRILTEAQNVVCGRFQIHHSTIQLETASNSMSEHCRPEMCQNDGGVGSVSPRGYNAV